MRELHFTITGLSEQDLRRRRDRRGTRAAVLLAVLAGFVLLAERPVQKPSDPEVSEQIAGDPIARALVVDPSPLRFEEGALGGARQRRSLQIRNDDAEPFGLTLRLPESPVFSLGADTCSATLLGPGRSCTVELDFEPRAAGVHSIELAIRDDRRHDHRVRVSATVSGPPPQEALPVTPPPTAPPGAPDPVTPPTTAPPPGTIEFSPNPVDFARQAVGTSASRTVEVTNRTGRTFKATYAAPDVATAANFALAGTCSGFFFLAGNSSPCLERVTFRPGSAGPHRGSVSVLDDAGRVVGTLKLEGSGQAYTLRVDPPEIDFSPPQGSAQAVDVTNVGDAPFTIGPVRIVGPGDVDAFAHDAAPCQFEALAPQARCRMRIRYTAGFGGNAANRSAALEIAPGGAAPVRVPLTWTRPLEPVIRAEPASLDFPATVVNSSTTLRVSFTNTGNGPATGVVIGVLGDDTPFDGSEHDCANLPPQAQCVVAVTFRPAQPGSFRGTLRFMTVNPPAQLATVPVTGTGAQAPPTVIVN